MLRKILTVHKNLLVMFGSWNTLSERFNSSTSDKQLIFILNVLLKISTKNEHNCETQKEGNFAFCFLSATMRSILSNVWKIRAEITLVGINELILFQGATPGTIKLQ